MTLLVEALGIDCAEPARLAAFWANVLDYEVRPSDDPNEVTVTPRDGKGTHLLFAKVPEVKAVKNRLHLDLRPENQDAEVERVLALGAKKVDIGQGQQTWVVLADPEGNEFCILRNLTPEERAEREKRDAVQGELPAAMVGRPDANQTWHWIVTEEWDRLLGTDYLAKSRRAGGQP